MSEILEEFKGKFDFIKIIVSYWKMALTVVLVVLMGIYSGFLFFGTSSLDVLLGLQAQEKSLEKRIEDLKSENAKLQKQLFELQQLDPDFNKGR